VKKQGTSSIAATVTAFETPWSPLQTTTKKLSPRKSKPATSTITLTKNDPSAPYSPLLNLGGVSFVMLERTAFDTILEWGICLALAFKATFDKIEDTAARTFSSKSAAKATDYKNLLDELGRLEAESS